MTDTALWTVFTEGKLRYWIIQLQSSNVKIFEIHCNQLKR